MKNITFLLLSSLSILAFSCNLSEPEEGLNNQELIKERLDKIKQITDEYNADSVYQKFEDISKKYPQEFLEVNISTLEIALEFASKTDKWQNNEEVQKIHREFEAIGKAIKSTESREEYNRLNEKFDSLYEEYQKLEKKYPHLHNYN